MATQSNPFDQFDGQSQPVPVSQIKPIISAPVDPYKSEQEARAQAGEQRAQAAEARAQTSEQRAESAAARAEQSASRLSVSDSEALRRKVAAFSKLLRSAQTFKSDYSNPGAGIENFAQAYSPLAVGTAGQRDWWSDFKSADNLVRNELFGASLSGGEKAAYGETTVQPGMNPSEVKVNIGRRVEEARAEMRRLVNSLYAGGYNKEQIDATIGDYLPVIQSNTPVVPMEEAPKSVGGGTFMTEQDLAYQAELQSAFDGGASIEQLNAIASRYQRPPLTGIETAIKARDSGAKGIIANVEPTGVEQAPSELQQAATGYAAGAANALTAGQMDELAPLIGLSPQQVEAAKAYLQQNAPVSSFLGEVTGGALASIPLVRGAGAALAGTRLAGAAPLIGETAYGAAYGAGEAPEGQGMTGALIGGAGALAGGALANRFMPGGSKTWSGIEAPAPTGRFSNQQVNPQQVIEAGQQFNVPVMTSDVSPPETFMGRIGQQVGEISPFGTAGRRRTQQEARLQAVETLLADVGVTVDQNIAKDVVDQLTKKRKADVTKYKDMKDSVIDAYNSMGDVPAPKALDQIDSLIASLERQNMPRQLGKLIDDIKDVKASLEGPGGLRKIEDNRATIFGLKGDDALSNVKDNAEKAFTSVYNALNEDMGDFIKANGNTKDFNKWKVANTKLATMVGELEQGALKKVMDEGDFDPEVVGKMLNSKNPNEVRLLFTNLGKQGRANARLLLLQNAAKKALDPQTGDINPQAFNKALMSAESGIRQFFGGDELKKIKGLTALLTATRRAQDAQFAPRTGERLMPFATAGGFSLIAPMLGLEPTGGIALASAFGAARSLYESAPVRNLLIRIGQTSGQTQARLIDQLRKNLPSATGAVGAEKIAGPQEQQFGAPAQ